MRQRSHNVNSTITRAKVGWVESSRPTLNTNDFRWASRTRPTLHLAQFQKGDCPATITECSRCGYTLVEMLMVVLIVSIVATVAIPAMSSAPASGLKSAGRVFASDLRLASELAVQYGTEYTVDFDVTRNRYQLRHTGTASPPPLQNPQAPPGTAIGTYLVELGSFGGNGTNPNGVRLKGAELKTSDQSVTNITFGPLGGTGPSRTDDTEIWLQRGTGGQSEYLRLTVSAVTGQVWLDQPATYPSN